MVKPKKPKRNLKILMGGIAIGLVLMLAILLLLASAAPKPNIKVSAINLNCVVLNKAMNTTCGTLPGFNFSSGTNKTYNITITAPSQYGEVLKTLKLNDPMFDIVKVIPSLPQNISAGSSRAFIIYINTSYKNYTGPILLSEIYSLKLPKFVNVSAIDTYGTNNNSSKTEFSGSLQGFNVTAGSTYFETFDITAGYNENITSFQTNTTGFIITNVSPKLPLKINSGKSQQFTIQIKTPTLNYSGPLSVIDYYNILKLVNVNVTQVNVFWHNVTENRTYFSIALNGFNSSTGSYLYTFDIDNSTATWLSFTTNTTGFRVVNVTPSLPYKITAKIQAFTLRIAVPNSSYSGPLTLIEQYK